MKKITCLTQDQERNLLAWRERWYAIGSACGPTDRDIAEETITAMYTHIGRKKPVFIFCASPCAAILALHILKKNSTFSDNSLQDSLRGSLRGSLGASLWTSLWASLRGSLQDSLRGSLQASLGASLGDSLWASLQASLQASLGASLGDSLRDSLQDSLQGSLRDSLGDSLQASLQDSLWDSLWASLRDSLGGFFFGGHEAYWIAYYEFMPTIGVAYSAKTARQLNWWAHLAMHAGWWMPYEQMCFISDRPTQQHVDEQRRLHCATGPAMSFSDGYALWAWHGVRVPQHVIEAPETLTLDEIRHEENAEIRRVMIERYGWDRMIEEEGAVLVAADTEPVGAPGLRGLFRLHDGQQVLVCACASSGHTFALQVPPWVESCQQAANWLANGDTSHMVART